MTSANKDFLLNSDPAIRWQVMRDLLHYSERTWTAERRKVAREGWGAKLLALQDPEGTWAGKMYGPKWTGTTYVMLLLKRLGLQPSNPQAQKACKLLLERGLYTDGGINYFPSMSNSETCVTGMELGILSYFKYPDIRVSSLVDFLLGEQMEDGGWNCERYQGAVHGSFHTTISVLEGLREWEKFKHYKQRTIRQCRMRAVAFLLEHGMFRASTSGDVVDPRMTRFTFPWRWRYDILRALDFCREAGVPHDPRMDEALDIIERKRLPDRTWKLNAAYPGRVYFDMEKAGKPSRWITLIATRVMNHFRS